MGNMFLAVAAAPAKRTNLLPFLIIVVVFGLLYVLMIRPQRNRQRHAMQMQSAVVTGQRVRTTAGMYGTITAVDDNDVVVEVAPGVQIRMLRRAIMEVLSDVGADDGSPSPSDAPADDWNSQDRNTQS